MTETGFAVREAAEVQSESDYFAARAPVDYPLNRRIFEAGFIRGWDKAIPKYPEGLTDEQIDEIADKMSGGLDGFLRTWGWRQFARAIEMAHGIVG